MVEKQIPEISQISIYLAKPTETFATVMSSDKDVSAREAAQHFDFEVDDARCRFYYFKTTSKKCNPPWLDFINSVLADDQRIEFSALSQNPNGILLLEIEGHVLAAAFGRSASSHLRDAALEPDFGIKTAMNLCGNQEVRQTRTQSNTVTPTQIDRQVGKPADTFAFGLSEAEDLRYISAHLKDDRNVTLQGRNNLTIKVIGEHRLTWHLIVARCREFLGAFGKRDFATLFPNYKNFREAAPAETAALDAELLSRLRSGNFAGICLGIPEFVTEENYSFTYSRNAKRCDQSYAFLDASQLNNHLNLPQVSIDQLKTKHIYAYSHEEDRTLPYRRWRIYNCIIFEHKLGERYFVLSDGRWLEVDNEFYASIMTFATDALHEEPCEREYENINISDLSEKRNKESIFNREVCNRRPSAILFDRAKLKIATGRRDKEFCDILDMTDAGRIRIIHCKPYKDSSSTNYLFAQASLYSAAFLQDQVFLTEIRNYIDESSSPLKNEYLKYIEEHIADLIGAKYDICLWLLYNHREAKPERSQISLMALYELKLMHDHLRNILKFKAVILRFVPVEKVQFQTDRKPSGAVT